MRQWRFILPYPPTVNHYWKWTRTGVTLRDEGDRYRDLVTMVLKTQKLRLRLTGRLAIEIVCEPPDRRRRDLDNILKATLDSLMHGGMVRDDEQFDLLMVRRGNPVPGGRLGIVVSEIDTERD
ncbi:RusA family crossover junction endodeoxyribonuclease [Salmonella enterica]